MDEPLRDCELDALLTTAGLAPSGDNTQPWRFVVDADARAITLEVDPARDPSPMNAGQRMARIAVGAALENLLRRALDLGWGAELGTASPPALARVSLTGAGGRGTASGEAAPILAARATNRRPYDGRPIPAEVQDRLSRQTPALDGVHTHWIIGGDRLSDWARLVGRADAAMFGEASMRRAFLSKVVLDAEPGTAVADGLSPSSLEATPADRLALRVMKTAPGWLFPAVGIGRVFAAKARRLVASSSGLCLITAGDDAEWTDLVVGRAMQQAWLALTAAGFSAQPMMSLLVLENAVEHGPPDLLEALGRDRLAALREGMRSLAPEIGGDRPAFLMRFGIAPAPSGRTGRLSWKVSTTIVASSRHSQPAGRA